MNRREDPAALDHLAQNQEGAWMSKNMLVRASRDGDQFHYLWAARRALQLLTPKSGLVAITIEGASTRELHDAVTVEIGEEVIDLAEYFGSTVIEDSTLVRYMQLKHSTLHSADPWQPSGLEKTIAGFAKRYTELRKQLPSVLLHEKVEFWFVTNRPISTDFIGAVDDASALRPPRYPTDLIKLKKFTTFEGVELAQFCQMLHFEGRQDDYWTQRNILSHDISGYLPSLDVDAPTRLKELVNRKALSESVANPAITKMDVLRALATDEAALFPAPCLIESIGEVVSRTQEATLVEAIVGAAGRPVIVHADAGVGKSIFSSRIGIGLPGGSTCILYDCFGNGQYRSTTGYRHRHRTGLVQIANELAADGLCHPLLPTTNADGSAYMRAFLHRIAQGVSVLRARNANALLCVIVDAADNAQMAAEEIGEPRSFVRDLLREKVPEGSRIVALCRPHRISLLNPPPDTLVLELMAFNREETASHLRRQFPKATEHDIDEFHRLSSCNPRVQALALSRKAPLSEILRLLGPNPTTVEVAIGDILEKSIATLRDGVSHLERPQVDLICAGLATLRPLIPISVLASMSGVDQAAIKSFALDLGRPLIVNGDTIQFFDEPAETWFRERFRPDTESVKTFIVRLRGVTPKSAYVASALPQLMLEAGQFSELVELALASSDLPETSPIERRDIELQRLQFALKAGLRNKRFADAAKLGLKAGGESAGDDRQRRLLQDNVDLAALFMDGNSIQELVSRRTFGSGWVGAHHVYEAALLSGHAELIGEARSRLRMGEEWLRNWSKQTPEDREKESVTDEDRAVMTMAHFRIHGSTEAARSLRAWHPRELSYSAGRILARRFLDHGLYSELDDLAVAAGNDLGLVLAITVEQRNLHRLVPKGVAARGFRLLADRRILLEDPSSHGELALWAVTAMVETAYQHDLCDANTGKNLLDRYLPDTPPYGITSHHSGLRKQYMRAYALRYALAGVPLQVIDLATKELRKEIDDKKRNSESSQLRDFKEEIGALLPWYSLWAHAFLGRVVKASLPNAIADAKAATAKAESAYREERHTADEIAELWMEALLDVDAADIVAIRSIIDWSRSRKQPLFTPTLNRLARLCAETNGSGSLAFEFAQIAFSLHRDERSDAQSKAEGYVEVARSILAISPPEAEAYFNQAIEVASKIGDENLARWDALIDLAEAAARVDRPVAELAYKFARCAEITWDYVVRDKHFAWSDTVSALTKLCPSSSLAIISRWRDRRFGNDSRILAIAVETLVSSGSLNPLDALTMISLKADWDECQLLESALPHCVNGESVNEVFGHVYRNMTLTRQTAKNWRRLAVIATNAGIELEGLSTRISDSDVEESSHEITDTTNYTFPKEEKKERNWDEVFAQCDLGSSIGISVAHLRFRAGAPPLSTETFLREAFKRITVGRESEFVKALEDVAEFDLYHLRVFLESFPSEWKGRLSVRTALTTVLKSLCRRFCMGIRRNRSYEVIPLELACELSGLDKADLLDVITEAIGESPEPAGSSTLFNLVGLLRSKLTDDEACEVLSYGLDLFEDILEDTDGDGPWCSALTPPATVEDGLAGYIWAGLASPDSAIRWESAHVVIALCAYGRDRTLADLFRHASVKTTTPFSDPKLPFFGLHAQQWLLIAAARAALEYGPMLKPFVTHLLASADLNQTHVLIRLFAARTLLALEARNIVALDAPVLLRLAAINKSPFESLDRKSSENFVSRTRGADAKDQLPDNDRFFFGIDFGPYWLAPLARCFGMLQSSIECEALKAIRRELGYKGDSGWDQDERGRRRLYQYEDTSHSHGSYPRVDEYRFYLSYHAMLITAGRLLAAFPLIDNSSEWQEDEFSGWIAGHDISRKDGRWLADRRDPQPKRCPQWMQHQNSAEWLSSITADQFDQVLFLEPNYVTVSGRWSNIEQNCYETISINTALVTRERSLSLLRALQTANNPHDFRIPDANDHLQINHRSYRLKGWLLDQSNERGIDSHDPWCGGVRFPAPEPAAFTVDLMQLSSDSDHRLWNSPLFQMPALRSEAWGHLQGRNSSELPNGSRLVASIQFVKKFLETVEMDLIVEVDIQRRRTHQRYEKKDENDFEYIPPSTRIFLVKSDGTIRTL